MPQTNPSAKYNIAKSFYFAAAALGAMVIVYFMIPPRPSEAEARAYLVSMGYDHPTLKLVAMIGCQAHLYGFAFSLYPASDAAYAGRICLGKEWYLKEVVKLDPRTPEQRKSDR